MMKIGVIYCLVTLFLGVFLCASVSALGNTTLIVHGTPFHNQAIWVLDPATQAVLAKVYTKANYTGVQNTAFSTSKSKVTFIVMDRHNGVTEETYEDFADYPTGGTIELWLPGAMNFNSTPVEVPRTNSTKNTTLNFSAGALINSSSNVTKEATAEESNKTGLMSGFVSGVRGAFGWFSWKYVLYFIGAVIVIAVILAAFVFGKKKIMKIKMEKYFDEDEDEDIERRTIEKKRPVTVAQKIADAEMRITEAQKELDELKDREIKKTERRLEMLKRLGNVQQRIDNKVENKDNPNQF